MPDPQQYEVGLLNHGRILRLSALKFPTQVALEYGGSTYTYSDLNREVNGVAAALVADGIATGDRVVIMSENTPQYFRLLFALAKVGAVSVPLNTMLPSGAIRDVLTTAAPRAAYVSATYREAFVRAHEQLPPERRPDLRELAVDLDRSTSGSAHEGAATAVNHAVPSAAEPVPSTPVSDDAAAIILFSSGSTGNPTGIVKSFANMAWSAINRQIAEPRASGDREYFCLPLAGIAFANFVLTDILTGATCVMADAFSPTQAADDLADLGITHVFLAPTMIRSIAEVAPGRTYEGVRRVESSFEFPIEIRRRAVSMFPNAMVLWSFGSTEATMARTPPDVFLHDTSCVGFASGLDEYRVVPANSDTSVGEVESRGPTRMLSYLSDYASGHRARPEEWFPTGDLGEVDEWGRLHFRGRIKDMIKTGGVNVFARDVEDVLVSHPAVRDAAVIGVPDDYWGEAVTAVVEISGAADLSSLADHVRDRLAPYQRPKAYYLADDLPKNPTGKLAKGVIRDLIASGAILPLRSSADAARGVVTE
jgi:acyl-CoA synthetase (AMP-forming)/AMP-acid ligase II